MIYKKAVADVEISELMNYKDRFRWYIPIVWAVSGLKLKSIASNLTLLSEHIPESPDFPNAHKFSREFILINEDMCTK